MFTRTGLSDQPRIPALFLALLLLASVLLALLGVRNSWAESGDWKNVTMIYTTDIKGKIEPCG